MARKVFYSFHYDADNWRSSQVRNIGVVEGNQTLKDNDWESVRKGKAEAIENWIAGQMKNRTCCVVLIGEGTAGRHWINHEITKGWGRGLGLVGVHIHRLEGSDGKQSKKGANPFSGFNLKGTPLTDIVKTYDPPFATGKQVYQHISENLEAWVEEAITIRGKY